MTSPTTTAPVIDDPAVIIHRVPVNDPAALFCHYPAESRPQEAFLELDLEDYSIRCDYNPEVDNSVPESVHLNRKMWAEIPCLTAEAANTLMDKLVPLVRRVFAGATVRWDGYSHRGQFTTADASEAWDLIIEACASENFETGQCVAGLDAEEWFGVEGNDVDVATRCGLTAYSTDPDIAAAAQCEEEAAAYSGEAGYSVMDASPWLTELRDRLRETERERLGHIAEQIRGLTAERNQLITAHYTGWGDTAASIGERVGLTAPGISKIAARTATPPGNEDTAETAGGLS